jgi:hypothetical protein
MGTARSMEGNLVIKEGDISTIKGTCTDNMAVEKKKRAV